MGAEVKNQAINQRWVLVATVLASAMAFIDVTALNLALPAIQSQLQATGAQLMWIVNSYAVVTAALILFGGALGDRFGRKRVFMIGIGLFVAASLACGLALSIAWLIIARAAQGLGAALMIPGSLAMISATFERSRRGRAIGIWSACCVVMTALGPILGGLLADVGWWRGIFFINLPLGLLSLLVLISKTKVPHRPPASGSLDYVGAVFSVVGLASLNFALLEAASRGWRDVAVLVAFSCGLCFLVAFVWNESKRSSPLLPLELFRNRNFGAACQLTLCFYSGLYGMLFFLSLNLIQVQQYRPWSAGAAQLPVMLFVILLSPLSGSLVDRYGPRGTLTVGGILATCGFCLLARPGVTSGSAEYWISFFPPMLLLGVAMGMTAAPLSTTIMNSVPQTRIGIASGINSTLSRLSGVLGIALLGPVLMVTFRHALLLRSNPYSASDDFAHALRRESWRLADAVPPPGMSPELTSAVEDAIRLAYVDAFRAVSYLCAAAVALSTLLAAAMLERHRIHRPIGYVEHEPATT